MRKPIEEMQKQSDKAVQLGREILSHARNELYLQMRFMDLALSALPFVLWDKESALGTDGEFLYFQPYKVMERFAAGDGDIAHGYLHTVFHCLFAHMFQMEGWDEKDWELACDIAVEWLIDDLSMSCVHLTKSPLRFQVYGLIKKNHSIITAQSVLKFLCQYRFRPGEKERWEKEFKQDDHSKWSRQSNKGPAPSPQQLRWNHIRERMQTELELFSKEAAKNAPSLADMVKIQNRKRYDYKEFLRKFAVLKEEMQVDLDTFDYVFYHYGMKMYGNMPLIEPLETKEIYKVEDFVIVLDTSMSCKGELVQKFLEETYQILKETESYFRKIQIHILQCDEQVRRDTVITDIQKLKEYKKEFQVEGQGGTDFRPPFAYVEELKRKGAFTNLRGMIYFTDGYGIFPAKKPDYETAFVFMKSDYQDVDVPLWAMKVIIEDI